MEQGDLSLRIRLSGEFHLLIGKLANGGHLIISEAGGELKFTIEEKEYAH